MKLMPQLTKYYKIVKEELNEYLIENDNINMNFFIELVKHISSIEHGYYKRILKNIHIVRKNGNNRADDNEENLSEYQKDLNRFYHREYFDEKNPFFHVYNKEFDKINYFQDNWEEQYYNYYFNSNTDETKENICEEYLQILNWNFEYYLKNSPPSWGFYYKYRMPPLFSDFYSFLVNNKYINFKFKKQKPIDPIKQLMIILPKKSANLLPNVISSELCKEELNFYEDKFDLEVMHGQKYIYSEPILSDFKHDIVENIFDSNKKKISNNESLRNKINEPFIFISK